MIPIPRLRRHFISGELYHITSRANNQEYFFEHPHCKSHYLSLLQSAKAQFDFELYAYCIMDNHVHLLMKMNNDSISIIMSWLNQRFAYFVNSRMGRNGHLWGDRYHLTAISGKIRTNYVIRYIHRNPIAAGITTSLNYPWSSHHIYAGRPEQAWFEANQGLFTFDTKKSSAKTSYLKYVSAEDDLERLAKNKILTERDLVTIENSQFPGEHEYVLALPEHAARDNVQGQLDLLFGRLCLMTKVNPGLIGKHVQSETSRRIYIKRFTKVCFAMKALSSALTITTKEDVDAYLNLSPEILKVQNGKYAVKLDREVKDLVEVYRQTFPQRTES